MVALPLGGQAPSPRLSLVVWQLPDDYSISETHCLGVVSFFTVWRKCRKPNLPDTMIGRYYQSGHGGYAIELSTGGSTVGYARTALGAQRFLVERWEKDDAMLQAIIERHRQHHFSKA